MHVRNAASKTWYLFYVKFNKSIQHQQSSERYNKTCILHCETTAFALVVMHWFSDAS